MNTPLTPIEAAVAYHERSKHHLHRYARSAGYMDWANQPNPFRRFGNTPRAPLPLLKTNPKLPFDQLFTPRGETGLAPTHERIAGFMELSMGLSAWKVAGQSRWSLRINPSSGNLHPTELYLILPSLGAIKSGFYHYSPIDHALEERARIPESFWRDLESHFRGQGFLAALTTIYWREAWKYGERAYRYCHHDVGHALACLALAARLWGWRLTLLDAVGTQTLRSILAIDRTPWPPTEAENPDLLCWVSPHPTDPIDPKKRSPLPETALETLSALPITGKPEPLSPRPIRWDVIYHTADALQKPDASGASSTYQRAWYHEDLPHYPSALTAAQVIRQRRSAVGFDPGGLITLEQLIAILTPTLPSFRWPPFDIGPAAPAISLVLFVHRVTDLPSGLYAWIRHSEHLDALARAMGKTFSWEPVRPDWPLFQLRIGDFRGTAGKLSCHQAIAADSAFSLGMLARFKETLSRGAWRYPELFREAGLIGQVLYLAAEAHGLRGTGIGCYFDDAVHELLGISDDSWQSLYHFTVGHPVEDPRLRTLPPYGHL